MELGVESLMPAYLLSLTQEMSLLFFFVLIKLASKLVVAKIDSVGDVCTHTSKANRAICATPR